MVLFVFVIMMLNLGAGHDGAGAALADAGDLDRPGCCWPRCCWASCCSRCSAQARRAIGAATVEPKAGRHRAVRPVPARRRTGLAAAAGGAGGAYHLGRRRARPGQAVMDDHDDRRFPWNMAWCWRRCCSAWAWSGVLVRRNILFMLMSPRDHAQRRRRWPSSSPAARWGQPDGQVMFILILTLAAAEVSRRPGAGAAALPPLQDAGCRRCQRDARMSCL